MRFGTGPRAQPSSPHPHGAARSTRCQRTCCRARASGAFGTRFLRRRRAADQPSSGPRSTGRSTGPAPCRGAPCAAGRRRQPAATRSSQEPTAACGRVSPHADVRRSQPCRSLRRPSGRGRIPIAAPAGRARHVRSGGARTRRPMFQAAPASIGSCGPIRTTPAPIATA